MAQPATASPTQPCPCHHITQALQGDKPPSETASTLLHKQLLCISFKRAKKKKKGIQQLLLHVSLTGLCAGLCCSIRVLGAPGSVPPCQVEGLQAKAQVVGVGEATGRLLRGCGEKHPACHCFFRVLEVCSD